MKKLFIILLLSYTGIVATAQTNDQTIKILTQAVNQGFKSVGDYL